MSKKQAKKETKSPFTLKGTTLASINAMREMSGNNNIVPTDPISINKSFNESNKLSSAMMLSWDELEGIYQAAASGIASMAGSILGCTNGVAFDNYPTAYAEIDHLRTAFIKDLDVLTDELIAIHNTHIGRIGVIDNENTEDFRLALSLGESYMVYNERFSAIVLPVINEISTRIAEVVESIKLTEAKQVEEQSTEQPVEEDKNV